MSLNNTNSYTHTNSFAVRSNDDNTNSAAQCGEVAQFPLLTAHMSHRTHMELPGNNGNNGHWSFKEILDKLMLVVIHTVRQRMSAVSDVGYTNFVTEIIVSTENQLYK